MEIVELIEETPESWPDLPEGFTLSAAAAALSPGLIWSRIEAYTAHRFSERQAVWVVDGPGTFQPNLTTATIDTVEVWDSPSWVAVELNPSPRGGLILPGSGPYRFTCTVGAGATVPEAALEAFRRLAEFMAQEPGEGGVSRTAIDAGPVTITKSRDPAWLARAMDYSGAGDLLRPYRRA